MQETAELLTAMSTFYCGISHDYVHGLGGPYRGIDVITSCSRVVYLVGLVEMLRH